MLASPPRSGPRARPARRGRRPYRSRGFWRGHKASAAHGRTPCAAARCHPHSARRPAPSADLRTAIPADRFQTSALRRPLVEAGAMLDSSLGWPGRRVGKARTYRSCPRSAGERWARCALRTLRIATGELIHFAEQAARFFEGGERGPQPFEIAVGEAFGGRGLRRRRRGLRGRGCAVHRLWPRHRG